MNENMIFKEHDGIMSVDIHNDEIESTKAVIRSFDYDTCKFTYKLTKDGVPLSLSGASKVNVTLKFGNEATAILDATTVDSIESIISFVYPEQFLSYSGQVLGEVSIQYSNGQSLVAGYFSLVVKGSHIDEQSGEIQKFYVQRFEDLDSLITEQSKEVEIKVGDMTEKVTEIEKKIEDNNIATKPDLNNIKNEVTTISNVTNVAIQSGIIYRAHRGLESIAPENTLKSFEMAYLAGYKFIETDIQVTKDNKWVVFHDDDMKRMTGINGRIRDFNLSELREINITSGNGVNWYLGETIPTLEDTLTLCQKLGIHPALEIKNYFEDERLKELVNLLRDYGFSNGRSSIICHYSIAKVIKKFDQSINTDVFYSDSKDFEETIEDVAPYVSIQFDKNNINLDGLKKFNEKGFKTGVFTIISSDNLKKYQSMGFDILTGSVLN